MFSPFLHCYRRSILTVPECSILTVYITIPMFNICFKNNLLLQGDSMIQVNLKLEKHCGFNVNLIL